MARETEAVIKTVDGPVRGRSRESVRNGTQYFSFQGIPYAKPPVGPLRFQAPQQVEPWTDIRDALEEGPSSASNVMGTNIYQETSSEDCLYLNVYTKELPRDGSIVKKPVLFWIHGGGFVCGSGNTDFYGPDYLVLKDVVLVTINYRLGALGFLSLQNEACPGNNGLKDQVEALRWVRRNISAFGGNPDNVTIFGESAGGASVQFHMLSPLSKGLFHRAITQSGSVLNPWACSRRPVECAFALGSLLGLKTDSKEELFAFLKTVSTQAIVEAAEKVMRIVEPNNYYLRAAFNPVAEPPHHGSFISESFETLVRQGKFHDVPYLLGVNTLEGLVVAYGGLKELKTKSQLERLLPPHIKLENGTPLADSIVEKIKNFYFKNGYDDKQCADALSAVHFLAGNDESLRGLGDSPNRKSKTYFYLFTFEGLTMFKSLLGFDSWKGTFHGDEIAYLLYSNFLKTEVKPGSAEDKMIDTMCQLWVDFAKTGNPTPETNLWPPYDNKEKSYLNIGAELKPEKNLRPEELEFWSSIFKEIDAVSSKL